MNLHVYQIILKEYGRQVRLWSNIKAKDALSAINQVCIDQRAYQEYTAVKMQ